jgi:hypothetical protein
LSRKGFVSQIPNFGIGGIYTVMKKDNAKTIAQYCVQNLLSQKEFQSYIKEKSSNFILLLLEKESLPSDTLEYINKRIADQKISDPFIRAEVKFLGSLPYRLVGLKGIFIRETYYPQEYVRLYRDIDVLVSLKDSYQAYKDIYRNDYFLTKFRAPTMLFRRLFLSFMQHLVF